MRFLLLLLFPFSLLAQKGVVYKDLEAALVSPLEVYHLELKRKGFTDFPKEIYAFSNLQSLDLSKNKLHSFPDSLHLLANLRVLKLSRNKIEVIPEAIFELENLVELDVWDNYINELPESIRDLKKLMLLDIRGVALSNEKYKRYLLLFNEVELLMSEPCDCQE